MLLVPAGASTTNLTFELLRSALPHGCSPGNSRPPGEVLDTHLDAGMSESAPFEWQPAECHTRVVGFVGRPAHARLVPRQATAHREHCPRIGAWEVGTLSGTATE